METYNNDSRRLSIDSKCKKKNEVFYKNSGYFEDAIDAKIIY